MKKVVIPVVLVAAFVAYAIYGRSSSAVPASPAVFVPVASSSVVASIPVASTSTSTSMGKYVDGTYRGSVADAYYGNIQVQATIQNDALADVQFLQYPNDRGQSIEINQRAMPVLKSEAIQSQSAQVNIVSGATQTSEAFQQSLAAALSQAQVQS
jgi:uncharacterized protein with FMN-binding domain